MRFNSRVLVTSLSLTVALAAGGCAAQDSETPSPDGGAVTVPNQDQPTAPSNAPSEEPSDEPQDEPGAETVRPEVEGIGMDEATQIALDEFGGELDSIESDHYDGIPVWEIELDDTDLGIDLEVVVDKETGEILHYEED